VIYSVNIQRLSFLVHVKFSAINSIERNVLLDKCTKEALRFFLNFFFYIEINCFLYHVHLLWVIF
jgi:hypothetical protein